MDCETWSPTLSGYFQRGRKKFPLFFVCIILISIFVKQLTIKNTNYERISKRLQGM